jgi:hypothetical protein
MGSLHRLVDLLQKLDPTNKYWRALQRRRAVEETDETFKLGDKEERKERLDDINEVFERNTSDYGRKLYLIENCIYGVDIQPIACQIAKLRFFISLIVDQRVNPDEKNLGVRPLPNLEAKVVAADTLVPIERPANHQFTLLDTEIQPLRQQLGVVRHNYFLARSPATKARCRERDTELRQEISGLLRESGWSSRTAKQMANWDPYDQNSHATFFDPEWMFGLTIGKVKLDDRAGATLRGNFAFINDTAGQMEFAETKEVESGFDIVIGNPPYIRLQTLKQKDPEQVNFLKDHYESARKGNYDIYVVFVERGMQLLKPTGSLAYILPHKFFNAQYGEPLRAILARGKHLSHIVHFGDQQVFPGATNYVCLLFLKKQGVEHLRFIKVENLNEWLKYRKGIEADIPENKITASEWNFVVGGKGTVIEKMTRGTFKLSDVASRIFQGLVTGADPVFILQNGHTGKFYSEATGAEHEIEKELMHPLCKGSVDIHRWSIGPLSKSILFPYEVHNGHAELISVPMFKRQYPKAWKYLLTNRERLEAREGGKWGHERWYAFGRSQNLSEMEQPKILTPSIAASASFTLDRAENYYFVGSGGGGGGGYGITIKPNCNLKMEYVLALLNSPGVDFYLKQISSPFSGGYYAYNRQYIEQLPIPDANETQQSIISRLVNYLLWLNKPEVATTENLDDIPDPLMLGYFEQMINGLVYELFFADELHAADLYPFKLVEQARLPKIESIPEKRRRATLRETFGQLYDTKHPLRGCIHDMGSMEIVRVIEGHE